MKIHATGKDLIIKESERLISGSVKIYTCEFTFDESWDGYAKTVVFSTGGHKLVNMALVDNVCEIPPEVLRPNARIRVGIYGTDGVRSRPTTYSDWIPVEQGADVTGNYAEPPTPSVFDQWVDAINEKHEEWSANEQARIEAENARVEAEQAREDLEPGYVAQATAYAESAKASEEASASSKEAAEGAKEYVASCSESATQSAAIAQTAAENTLTYSNNAAYSAAQATASADEAARIAEGVSSISKELEQVQALVEEAEASAEAAENSANEAATEAANAASNAEKKLAGHVAAAETAEANAKAAQTAAEKARDDAKELAGGDYATKAQAQAMADAAEADANAYTDQQIAAIPTPDVSGQIGAHNANTSAHSDIRSLVSTAQTTANNAASAASAAQTTANEAKAAASNVPSDLSAKLASAIYKSNTPKIIAGELAVGTVVSIEVGGIPEDFIVVHQGNPDASLYDDSCNGTWLMAKYVIGENSHRYDDGNSLYPDSEVRTYLENVYFGSIDAAVRSGIKTVKVP